MNRSRFSFHNVRLSRKMLVMYFFAVFIPIVLTNILFFLVTLNNVKQQQRQDSTLVLEQINNDFQKTIDDAVGISSSLYTNLIINVFLEQNYTTDVDYIEEYNNFLRTLNQTSPINPTVNSIRFYTDNPTIIYSGGVYPLKEIEDENIYKRLTEKGDGLPVIVRSPASSGLPTFRIYRNLNYFYNNKQKIVNIEINPAAIKDIFSNITFKGNVYLLNEKGEIQYSTDSSVNWKEDHILFQSVKNKKQNTIITTPLNSGPYLKNWQVVGTISEGELLKSVYQSGLYIILLACINLLAPTVIIIFISRSFLTRLNRVLKHVKKMKHQSFELIEDEEYDDEIGQLTSEFNRMTKKINELINDVLLGNIQRQELEIKRNRAQLSALQSQINPHFLFNALETIRMRSLMKEEQETAKIIHNMAKIFRNSLTWGKDFVPIKAEVNLIKSFLEIQQYRFEDKLNYEINVDPEVEDCMIPNMGLLPFIENASIHGIEPLKANGLIKVTISRTNDFITCIVEDNGVGMTEEKKFKLLTSLEAGEDIGENVGMKNVFYRLKLYYQNQFHFQIDSEVQQGTNITIKLPFLLKK